MHLPNEILTTIAFFLEDVVDLGCYLSALQPDAPWLVSSDSVVPPPRRSLFLHKFLTHLPRWIDADHEILPPATGESAPLLKNDAENLISPLNAGTGRTEPTSSSCTAVDLPSRRRHVLRVSLMERRIVSLVDDKANCDPMPLSHLLVARSDAAIRAQLQFKLHRQQQVLDSLFAWLCCLGNNADVLLGPGSFGIALTLRAGGSTPAANLELAAGSAGYSAAGSPWLHRIDQLKLHLASITPWLVELRITPDRSRRHLTSELWVMPPRDPHSPTLCEPSTNSSVWNSPSSQSSNGLWLADSLSANVSPLLQTHRSVGVSNCRSGTQGSAHMSPPSVAAARGSAEQRWMCLSEFPFLRRLALTQTSVVAWLKWLPKLSLPRLREVIIAPMLIPERGVTTATWAEFFTALSVSRSVERLVLLVSPTQSPDGTLPFCRAATGQGAEMSPPNSARRRDGLLGISTPPRTNSRAAPLIVQSIAVISGILRSAVQAWQGTLRSIEFGVVLESSSPFQDISGLLRDHLRRVRDILTQLATQLGTMDIEPYHGPMEVKWAVLFRPSGHELGPASATVSDSLFPCHPSPPLLSPRLAARDTAANAAAAGPSTLLAPGSSSIPLLVIDSSTQAPLLREHYPLCLHSALPTHLAPIP